ncbi:MAG: hypothetical protein AB8G23_06095 [Myxococcota bacterium]
MTARKFLCVLLLGFGIGGVACEDRGGDASHPVNTSLDAPVLSLAAGERGRLALSEHVGTEHFVIQLEVRDERQAAAGSLARPLRLVSVDGRRFDTLAEPHLANVGWLQFGVDADFLRGGLYMIEVDALDDHALDLRRFVLEVVR